MEEVIKRPPVEIIARFKDQAILKLLKDLIAKEKITLEQAIILRDLDHRKTIAARIKSYVVSHGGGAPITDFASNLKMNRQVLSNVLNGRNSPLSLVLEIIGKGDVTIKDIFGGLLEEIEAERQKAFRENQTEKTAENPSQATPNDTTDERSVLIIEFAAAMAGVPSNEKEALQLREKFVRIAEGLEPNDPLTNHALKVLTKIAKDLTNPQEEATDAPQPPSPL